MPAVELVVGGLPFQATSQSLVRLLWDQVVPERATIILDRASGRSKGFGFLAVTTPEDAVMACRAADQSLDGRILTINVVAGHRRLAGPLRPPFGQSAKFDIPGTQLVSDVFRDELLASLDVTELSPLSVEDSLARVGLVRRRSHDESLRHQLLRLVEALAESPSLLPDLDPRLFEYIVGSLLAASGYKSVTVTGPSADGGIDILATKNVLGRSLFLVQCKRYAPENKVGRPDVVLTYGVSAAYGATKAALVTTSAFTKPAAAFIADNENRIAGFDGRDLEIWLKATSQLANEAGEPR